MSPASKDHSMPSEEQSSQFVFSSIDADRELHKSFKRTTEEARIKLLKYMFGHMATVYNEGPVLIGFFNQSNCMSLSFHFLHCCPSTLIESQDKVT